MRHLALMPALACVAVCLCTLACSPETESSGVDWRALATAQGLEVCGDRTCDDSESCSTCPTDCSCTASCGDGVCAAFESCLSCGSDCGACSDTCGDERCTGFEDCELCPGDCGACSESCGDGRCTSAEDCASCPSDCGGCELPECGDGTCDDGEDCRPPGGSGGCEADCGQCPDVCGDNVCSGDEDCANCDDDCGVCVWPPENESLEDELLVLLNARRQSGGDCPTGSFAPMQPLTRDDALRHAARLHSLDLGENAYFDHDGQDGRDPFARMRDAGYTGSPRGENIAAGNGTAQATFTQWVNSEGHCRNMFNPSFNEIGIGYARVDDSPFRHYWTQNFGVR